MTLSLVRNLSGPNRVNHAVFPVRPSESLRCLRLSVTDLCNFRCRHCMPVEGVPKVDHDSLCSLERLAQIVAWLVTHTGIERVVLTGGEPLLRPGIGHLVASLSCLSGLRDVSLATNGALLSNWAWALRAAGLSGVEVSLPSLDVARFSEITRGGRLSHVLAGIETARAAGLTPVTIAVPLLRSGLRRDLPALLDYAADNGLPIRFVEFPRGAWCDADALSVDEARQALRADGENGQGVSSPWASLARHPELWRALDRDHICMDAFGRIRLGGESVFDLSSAIDDGRSLAILDALDAFLFDGSAGEEAEV